MARPNDVIWLRFYRDDRECPPIETEAFNVLVQALKNQVNAVASAFQVQIAGAVFSIAAPPQRGCLEIPLVLSVLNDPSIADVLSTVGRIGVDAFKAFEEHIDTVTFFATIVFGGHSVMDLWAKRGEKNDAIPQEKQILFQISSFALKDPAVVQGAVQLGQAAAACDMHRIEIQVRDDPPVLLYTGDGRIRQGLIGSRPNNPVDAHTAGPMDPAGRHRIHFRMNELEQIRVSWNGTQYSAYRAFTNDPNRAVLLLWAAKKSQPVAWETTEATGVWVDTRTITPIDPVQDEFEVIDGAFLVQGLVRIED